MALRIGRLARALRRGNPRQEARLVADCTRALRALAGEDAVDRIPLGARALIRGRLTARALSAGRDRPWPWAFTRQLDPEDPGFLPSALLPVHLNLSYRDWSLVSLPGWPDAARVDPGGWVTPQPDGPSIGVWVGDSRRLMTLGPLPGWGVDPEGRPEQRRLDDTPMVRTTAVRDEVEVEVDVFPTTIEGRAVFGITARIRLRAPAPRPVRVGFAIRPANPEGVSPIFDLIRREDGWWMVNNQPFLFVGHPGHERALASWRQGDAYHQVGGALRRGRRRDPRVDQSGVNCPAGLATGCELYRVNLSPGETFKRTVYAAADDAVAGALRRTSATRLVAGVRADWEGATRAGADVTLPAHDRLFRACRTVMLTHLGPAEQAPDDYVAAALQLTTLAGLGFTQRAQEAIRAWPTLQDRSGAWMAREGEWAHTGAALWALTEITRLTGDRRSLLGLYPSIARAARWLLRTLDEGWMPRRDAPSLGGPEGQTLWDALWACAGLREAALAARWSDAPEDSRDFSLAHGRALEQLRTAAGQGPLFARRGALAPTSASAAGLIAVWPLQLVAGTEALAQRTMGWLCENSLQEAGLFHDTVHSGVSPLLTAVLGQARIADGQPAAEHLDYLAAYARGAGGWPDAFHPARGGVAGDGESVLAAAGFAALCRSLLVREEGQVLHLFQGADRRWWSGEAEVDGLPTRFGRIRLRSGGGVVRLDGDWRERPSRILWHKPAGVEGVLRVDGDEVRGDEAVLEAW